MEDIHVKIHSCNEQQNLPHVPAFTKEYLLARPAEVQHQLRHQNPDLSSSDLDLKISSGWWEPIFDLPTVVDESVLEDVNDKLQIVSKEFAAANYSREALERFAAEARSLLADHDEALRLQESAILKNPGVWDKMHETVMAKRE